MGVEIENNGDKVLVHGRGLRGLKAPDSILDVGNSGTTTRLMSGILAAQPFVSTVNGDASIQKRPMKRIITPLSQMGADIQSLRGNDCTPLEIHGTNCMAYIMIRRWLRHRSNQRFCLQDFMRMARHL